MSTLTEHVAQLVMPKLSELGLNLWDVEYKKEGAEYYLRVYIDRESGVSIDDCREVHEFLSPILDEEDPIEESYYLEISSAGLIRDLKKDSHYTMFLGKEVTVNTYKSIDGLPKQFPAVLLNFDSEFFTFEIKSNNVKIKRSSVCKISVDLL